MLQDPERLLGRRESKGNPLDFDEGGDRWCRNTEEEWASIDLTRARHMSWSTLPYQSLGWTISGLNWVPAEPNLAGGDIGRAAST